jgi:hypothetical protein
LYAETWKKEAAGAEVEINQIIDEVKNETQAVDETATDGSVAEDQSDTTRKLASASARLVSAAFRMFGI